ncbi:hypothetical protein CYJ25_05330 [Schaalia turicensis]|uniref:Uncharacterized protein n=1 Tax=Schaalia turicensis TaxID=131111 RepID=A0A2I1I4W2_9ACTO|nr:hypothetical protein CYJ25_05330 [Schaalia turicensis]
MCSAKISMGRRQELLQLVDWAKQNECCVSFLTLTQQHHKGQKLDDLWKMLSKAWQILSCRQTFKRFKKDIGFVGYVRANEVTHGVAGWHVHSHYLLVTKLDPVTAENQRFMSLQWRDALQFVGSGCSLDRGAVFESVSGDTAEIVAKYVGKGAGDIGLEMTMGNFKRGRKSTSRTPFQVLADLGEQYNDKDYAIWQEWVKASKGKRQLQWSRYFKKIAGIDELTDQQVAEQGEERETLGFISRVDYLDLLESNYLPRFMDAVEQKIRHKSSLSALGSRMNDPPVMQMPTSQLK